MLVEVPFPSDLSAPTSGRQTRSGFYRGWSLSLTALPVCLWKIPSSGLSSTRIKMARIPGTGPILPNLFDDRNRNFYDKAAPAAICSRSGFPVLSDFGAVFPLFSKYFFHTAADRAGVFQEPPDLFLPAALRFHR